MGQEMQCQHCKYIWVYTGKKKHPAYITCPNCLYKVPLPAVETKARYDLYDAELNEEALMHRHHKLGRYAENKKCPAYLGVHIAEQVLGQAFKNVRKMPYGNPGYDVICNHNKKIDIKSACEGKRWNNWTFNINHNTIADYFLCLAFDNRKDLNPLYVWLIPGSKLNHLMGAVISQSTIHKWDAYRLDISKINKCCDAMRTEPEAI